MVDYRTNTGTSGSLIIRDDGYTVSFLIECRSSATYTYGKDWSGRLNGAIVGGKFDISGATTITVGSWPVTTSQTVEFTMAATNTSGLGGPTTAQQYLNRATRPSSPGTPTYSNIHPTSVYAAWTQSSSDGGSPIDAYLLRRNTLIPVESAGYVDQVVYGIAATNSGLTPATQYYYCVYAHNAVGYSDRSGESGVVTLPVPPASITPGTPTTTTIPLTWTRSTNGNRLTGYDLQYALDDAFTDPTTISVGVVTSATLTNLRSGRDYYIRMRGKTAGGVSTWSAAVTAHTVASVFVSDGTQWLPAEVYMSDGTNWDRAEVLISDGTNWVVPG